MPHWVPSWQLAVTVAGSLGVVSLAARIWMHGRTRTRDRRIALAGVFGWQAAVLIGIYGLWQFTGSLATVDTTSGIERGRRLWDLERYLHLPSEGSFQAVFLPHHKFIQFLNLYYILAHYNVLLLMLAWLIWRHRDRYQEARTVIALATFASLALQLVAVAPPRFSEAQHVVDTPSLYGQSVYGRVGEGFSDQYAAMPSVHILWCSAVAFFIWRSTKSRWRWIGVAHALLTWTVVVATGNHFWADGIVAIALLAAAFWTVRLGHYLAARVSEWLPWTPARPVPRVAIAVSAVSPSSAQPSPSLSVASDAVQAPDPVPAGQVARASPPNV